MQETNPHQSFWYNNNLVHIPTHVHPTLNAPFVIWSDIEHCFPGATRIQNGDCFVPLLRDERLYRQVNPLCAFVFFSSLSSDTSRRTTLVPVVCGFHYISGNQTGWLTVRDLFPIDASHMESDMSPTLS